MEILLALVSFKFDHFTLAMLQLLLASNVEPKRLKTKISTLLVLTYETQFVKKRILPQLCQNKFLMGATGIGARFWEKSAPGHASQASCMQKLLKLFFSLKLFTQIDPITIKFFAIKSLKTRPHRYISMKKSFLNYF